ncbi:MAG TPA: hydroxymethylbilane synthase [Candidatus Acidoferrum sp.]|nr:hydroxymethylbilane synthase [Candidatus Acidoferrum sp.]
MKVRIGTRGSALALAQAGSVAAALREVGARVEIVSMRTEGDRRQDARLADVGGKGLFVREIEKALLARRVDLAVHSLKDLPADTPDGLALAAFPPREDPCDVLVTRTAAGLDELPAGAVIGTSSLRRRALLLAARSDLSVVPLRGNVDTRLAKLASRECDAVVLAAAGLRRLALDPPHVCRLDVETFVPAVGQGILALEIRDGDGAIRDLVAGLNDPLTETCARAERAYLRRLGASCHTPMAAHATLVGLVERPRLFMSALVASEDGRQVLRADAGGAPGDAEAIGRGLAELLLERGAEALTPLQPTRWSP